MFFAEFRCWPRNSLDRRIANMRTETPTPPHKVKTKILMFLLVTVTPVVLAEDFKTLNGKEYKDATVNRVEPDGIVVTTKSGISKLYFTELPKEVQSRFHYDPQNASTYSAQQSADYTAYQTEQDEARRQHEQELAKNNAMVAQQQAANNRLQTLQARYNELQRQEDNLLGQIGEAKQPGPAYYGGKNNRTLLHHPNPQKSQVPLLQSHLSDVRKEKNEIRKQLEKAQR